uniref:Retrovirus-related Pol polyprotein from transposon TNT 1-94 n=1 Tax=Tanacetum cinerariifolium TaxID=118510 RepID=A0A699H4Z0_TANCI|nr:retrovirus-related Pol polyprotein from transposon TNT 1-94 [Tanacetum cinerariifolium]
MSGTVPPIPPPLGTNPGNAGSPNRVDTIPMTTPTTRDRFLVYLDGLEPYLLEILKIGPFVPKSPLSTSTNILPKPQKQWSPEDRRIANQDKRLKTHEGPSDTRDTKIAALRLKFNAFKALEDEKDDESLSSKDKGVTMVKPFMAIAEDEIIVGKANARSGQWVKIAMKKDPLPPLPKLSRAEPTESSVKVIKKKAQAKLSSVPDLSIVKKVDSSTGQLLLTLTEEDYLKRSVWCLDSGCSRHKTGVKQYLHRYSKKSGHKVVFGDNFSGDTEGYGLVNSNRIAFTKAVAKRRNITLIEAARTMLNSLNLPKQFWEEAINTACYTQNRSIIVKRHGRTSYDVFRGRSPDVSYFHVFGCPMFIHNHRDQLGKFYEKVDDVFFLGYSTVAKAFKVFNIRRQEMQETYHVTFSEDDEAITQSNTEGKDDYFPYVPAYDPLSINNITIPDTITPILTPTPQDINSLDESPELSIDDDHPIHHKPNKLEPSEVQNDTYAGVTTKRRIRDSEAASAHECLYVNFVSEIKPNKLVDALEEEGWIIAMQEEMN